MRTPLIGVTCAPQLRSPAKSEFYISAIERAGAHARFMEPRISIETLFEECHGILIPGGSDINPSRYKENMHYPCVLESSERTDFEIALVHRALKETIPVFGICYGMQLMNVAMGGSLYQDLSSELPHVLDHRFCDHGVNFLSNPLLLDRTGMVNSSHHQAVRIPGNTLVPFCLAEDGVIEAMYGEGHPFFVGVQWHPERSDDRISELLFRLFIEACNGRL